MYVVWDQSVTPGPPYPVERDVFFRRVTVVAGAVTMDAVVDVTGPSGPPDPTRPPRTSWSPRVLVAGGRVNIAWQDNEPGNPSILMISSSGTWQCQGGATDCAGTCRDLQNDPATCGGCLTPCAGGVSCVRGVCQNLDRCTDGTCCNIPVWGTCNYTRSPGLTYCEIWESDKTSPAGGYWSYTASVPCPP
jgi:hypothetical protein